MATLDAVIAGAEQATDQQGIALADLVRRWKPIGVHVAIGGDGLPETWWLVTLKLRTSDFVCGIAPDGSVSS